MAEKHIFQLKATLKDIRPPVWRRIQVAGDIRLAQLHRVLQEVMGWTNSHLYQFTIGGINYGVPDDDWGLEIEDAKSKRPGNPTLTAVRAGLGGQWVGSVDFGFERCR